MCWERKTMERDKEPGNISRRNFMVRTAIGGAGLVLAPELLSPQPGSAAPKVAAATMMGVPFEPKDQVRLGIIGVGGRGTSLLKDLLTVDNVYIKAICDIVPAKVEHAQKMVADAGQAKPVGLSKG